MTRRERLDYTYTCNRALKPHLKHPFRPAEFLRVDSDGELTGVYQKSGHARRRCKVPWILMNEVRNQFRAVTNYVVRNGVLSGELRWHLSLRYTGLPEVRLRTYSICRRRFRNDCGKLPAETYRRECGF